MLPTLFFFKGTADIFLKVTVGHSFCYRSYAYQFIQPHAIAIIIIIPIVEIRELETKVKVQRDLLVCSALLSLQVQRSGCEPGE